MRISEPARIRRPIPLTPLVDIVFLLLMFFMLSSTFTKFSAFDITTKASGRAQSGTAVFPGIIIVVNGPGQITINGVPTSLDQVTARLDDLQKEGAKRAALRTGQGATVQDLVNALESLHASNLTEIAVVE